MKQCKVCAEKIPSLAKVCSHCNSYQNRVLNFFHVINNFSIVATILSIGLFYLSLQQYKEAKQERFSAQQAIESANKAKEISFNLKLEVQKIYNQTLVLKDSINQTSNNLILITKYNLENSYILASSSFLAMGESPARNRLETNMDKISHLINNQPTEQKKFWDSLKKLFPDR